ncbi:MAG: DUF308 domain-containing protein [Clostridiales bacterium]|nr:DUF308 domain-containing protein [Clostridiales bacterium]
MKMRSIAPMRIAKTGYVVMSLIFCILGMGCILHADIGTKLLGTVLGIALIVFGIVKVIGYFSKDLFRLAFQYDLEFGSILTVLGIAVLVHPIHAVNLIVITMGVLILADAFFKVRIARDSREFGISDWWFILGSAIVTGILGLLLMFRPGNSAEVLIILLGLSLVAEGILNLSVAICTVKIIKNQYPDHIDPFFEEKYEKGDKK